MEKVRTYYYLTKPGIIYGNSINAAAGFLFAAKLHIQPGLLAATILGIALVIASACVVNNYIDRDIDRKMQRTKKRAIASGKISTKAALSYALVLAIIGFGLLIRFTNILTVLAGLVGYIDYIVLYGIGKRTSVHGTLIGSVSGATPIVAGYTAVTSQLDTAALILFSMLVCWQMAHFYAIAMYRHKDYAAADIPVLPLKKGMVKTKIYIMIYIALFGITASVLTVAGYTGIIFLIVMAFGSLAWLIWGIRHWRIDNTAWGKKMFGYSLIITITQAVMLVTGRLLP